MLRPTVIEVKAMENYNLLLKFDNGERKIFDVKPYINGAWYGELNNKNLYRTTEVHR